MLKAPPSGELANAVSLRGFIRPLGKVAKPQALMEGTARYPHTKKKDQRTRKSSLVFLLFS